MKIAAIRPPRGVLPAVVAAEAVIGRSEAATVSLGRLWVYPTGLQVRLLVDWDEERELDPSETTNRERWGGPRVGRDSPTPILSGMGTGAGGGHGEATFWLIGLPPPGPVEVFCEWRAAGIAPTRVELDAEAIAAAGRAQKLFDDPDEEEVRR